jgi:hypothetical protein
MIHNQPPGERLSEIPARLPTFDFDKSRRWGIREESKEESVSVDRPHDDCSALRLTKVGCRIEKPNVSEGHAEGGPGRCL